MKEITHFAISVFEETRVAKKEVSNPNMYENRQSYRPPLSIRNVHRNKIFVIREEKMVDKQ